ncbi:MAG: CocE/NonD family hydrolase [Dehalococcoidia bacterium]
MPNGSPGFGYALDRLRRAIAPPVTITPPPRGVRFERDVPVMVRDGTTLRVNVFRPATDGRYPVIMCAHPYGKDRLPQHRRIGYLPEMQYRIMRQSGPISISAWTSWESPDPAFWVAKGYAVVNCDLRGFGPSDGTGDLFSDQEARDYHDLIEWAAAQPWSSGRVGLNGVSYLALSQWKVAALRPPHLAAICPWEGFSDLYRDFARPGGIREDGFLPIWSAMVTRGGRCSTDLRREQKERPLWDDWWASRTPELERIEVPALVCGSFSDHSLHTRGSFEGFHRISSEHKWLYTHRGGKWAVYYSDEAKAFQARFFDCFLKGEENGMRDVPPLRLEVRDTGETVHQIREEVAWPLPSTRWTSLYLHAAGSLNEQPAAGSGAVQFDSHTGRATFSWQVLSDLELTGPMKLRLHVEARGADDLHLFAALCKLRDGTIVGFEGSYGFPFDTVTKGWLKASHRRIDEARSEPWRPVHTHTTSEPLQPGQIVPVEIELLPSSTVFRRGDMLRLDVRGHWFFPRDPFRGQFPAMYESSPPATAVLHMGGTYDAHLLIPVIAQ